MRDGLGAHAGELQQAQHGGFVFLQQLVAEGHGAGGDEVADVGGHAFADAGDVEQRLGVGFGRGERRRVDGLLLDGFGGAAIGADAEGVGGVDFEQRSGFVEETREGDVVHKVQVERRKGRDRIDCRCEIRPGIELAVVRGHSIAFLGCSTCCREVEPG